MATGYLHLRGKASGLVSGDLPIEPDDISFASPVGERRKVTVSTNTSVSIPSGATFAVIQFPAGNTVGVALKGASGDTGVALKKTGWTAVGLDTGATMVLHAALSSVTVEITFY